MINIDEQNSKTSIIDLKPDNIVVEPFPHVIKQPFLNPDFYQRLKKEFPANQNNSYHSVNAINSIKDYRRFIYLNVSSTAQNIW